MNRENECKVFVKNIPYSYNLNDLKRLFQEKVGDVIHIKLYTDGVGGKFVGCCNITFRTQEAVKKAITSLHHFVINDRKIIVYEDKEKRDDRGQPLTKPVIIGGFIPDDTKNNIKPVLFGSATDTKSDNKPMMDDFDFKYTYGLKPEYLRSIGVKCPLCNRIFITNLHPNVDKTILKETFSNAGRITGVQFNLEPYVHALIEFNHPLYAVQAIAMYNNKMLLDRRMSVRMDRFVRSSIAELPEGLSGIKRGLGPFGNAIFNFERV